MDSDHTIRAYYRALDTESYEALSELLAPGFVHVRPDRTIDGDDRFVQFMRDDRPITDTAHEITNVYYGADGVAVIGILNQDDRTLMRFIDVFAIDAGRITSIRTFTDTDRSRQPDTVTE